MNSSEIKKCIWGINLIILLGLVFVAYLLVMTMQKPAIQLEAYQYQEPQVKIDKKVDTRISKSEIEGVLNWKPPEPPPKTKVEPKAVVVDPNANKPPVVEEPKSQIGKLLELQMVLGRLAFIQIKKDNILKSYVVGDEIRDGRDQLIGVLKEVRGDKVLILANDKIEELLFPEDESKKVAVKVFRPSSEPVRSGPSIKKVVTTTGNGHITSSVSTNVLSPHAPANVSVGVSDNTKPGQTASSPVPGNNSAPVVVKKYEGTFNNFKFEFQESVDSDGVPHRRIDYELSKRMNQKDNIKKFIKTDTYNLEYRHDGVLVKSINDPDVKSFLSAFGIKDNDLIMSVNGQSLGNKSEDDLLEMYQVIRDTAKYVTIELKQNGKVVKFRVSTNKLKNMEK